MGTLRLSLGVKRKHSNDTALNDDEGMSGSGGAADTVAGRGGVGRREGGPGADEDEKKEEEEEEAEEAGLVCSLIARPPPPSAGVAGTEAGDEAEARASAAGSSLPRVLQAAMVRPGSEGWPECWNTVGASAYCPPPRHRHDI
jgi:hypothetical protein